MDTPTLPDELQILTLPDWVCWLAQDADGQWWGYEVEPLEHDTGWYENEVGRNTRLIKTEAVAEWHEKLHRLK